MRQNKMTFFQASLWIGSIILVLLIGIYYFPREDSDLSFLGSLYYSIRLFIMEHDLPDFPKAWPLISIYFFAPAITLSAIGTAVTYLLHLSPALKARYISDHVVVCGVGRTGKIMAATLKQKGVSVVGVDSGSPENFDEWCSEHKVTLIYGDFLSQAVLKKAGAERARSIIFVSGDDLLNLEGVVGAYGWLRSKPGPLRLMWVHIANENLADKARLVIRTKETLGIRIFDTYRIAATKMVDTHFPIDIRQCVSEITILGFGKFGRDLFEVLARDRASGNDQIFRVVDIRNRENEVHSLAEELEISNQVTFIKADIQDLHLPGGDDKAFFLCTDDDIKNLSVALMLSSRMESTCIYARMATWPMPAIEYHLREKRGITFVNINDLVVNGIQDLPGIFEHAKLSDLKRLEEEHRL